VILLAAGSGKRMKSRWPKVLHRLAGKPLLSYPLRTALNLNPKRVAVVVGAGADSVKSAFADEKVTWVSQEKQLGTGHAVLCAKEAFRGFSGDLLILSGDVPLVSEKTLLELLREQGEKKPQLSLVTAFLEDPSGYGRILRNERGGIARIVEEREATEEEKRIREINAGIYAASPRFLFAALARLDNRNTQGEYYLTDVVGLALEAGGKVGSVRVEDAREILGINTREELAMMEKILQQRINRKWMEAGVTLRDPETTYIEEDVAIGKDTIIGPNTHLRSRTVIGERCVVEWNAYITAAEIGNEVQLKFSVVLTDCRVGRGAIVGPFAHLRPGTVLEKDVHIGNFVEVKNSSLGEGTKANHLSYIGDATVGRETNIGAGTITCNYDGFDKYRTRIGDRVQVGSDSTLVAPVSVGDDAYIATATTVRHDVPPGALVYNERLERVKEGWTEEFRGRKGKKEKT